LMTVRFKSDPKCSNLLRDVIILKDSVYAVIIKNFGYLFYK
jgi:hypothetical protein